jgi:hypothetical protein
LRQARAYRIDWNVGRCEPENRFGIGAQHAQQQMLGLQLRSAVLSHGIAREEQCPPRLLAVSFEHGATLPA